MSQNPVSRLVAAAATKRRIACCHIDWVQQRCHLGATRPRVLNAAAVCSKVRGPTTLQLLNVLLVAQQ